jgi:peptidoglycan/LPS O-acetylase OafA/YrhL
VKKIGSVEWLRGVASFGVTEMHMFCALNFFATTDVFFQKYIFPLSIVGRLGVQVFFVISGFVIPYSMWANRYTLKQWGNFIARRLIRLEPPYVASIVLVLFTTFVVSVVTGKTGFSVDWQAVLLHLGYINVFFGKPWLCGVYWTLAIEFQYYLLIAVLYPLLVLTHSYLNAAVTVLLAVASYFISIYVNDNFIFYHFPIFIVGIITFQKTIGRIAGWQYWLQLAGLLSFVFVQSSKGVAVAVGGAALAILYNLELKWKPLYFLGKISYSLYLIHWIVGVELVRNLALYFYPNMGQPQKIVVAILGIALSVLASVLFYNVIEKQSISWGKMLKSKPVNNEQPSRQNIL